MPDKQRIVSIVSTKGGTGKTTQTYNFGRWLGDQGYRVLLIDLDHQANLTSTFGLTGSPNTIAGVFDREFKDPVIVPSVAQNVDMIPGSMHLDEIGEQLVNRAMREFVLYNWIDEKFEEMGLGAYDYILLDNHPDLSNISKNSVMISHHVLSFVEPSQFGGFDAMDSLKARMETFRKEARIPRSNDSFVTADVLFVANKVEHNTNSSHEFKASVNNMNDVIALIPKKEFFNRSTIEHKMIFDYDDGTSKNKSFFEELNEVYQKIQVAIDKE